MFVFTLSFAFDFSPYLSQYEPEDEKSRDAALNFNFKRGNGKCTGLTTENSSIRIIRTGSLDISTELHEFVCGGTRKAISFDQIDFSYCAYDATPPAAVYIRNTMTNHEQDGIKHAFSALSDLFGRYGYLVDVFELFGEFEPGQRNILFSDDAKSLITDDSINLTESFFNYDGDDESLYKKIQCNWSDLKYP